jgi:NTP pyrophosphatase (non-canonical NTP hydrolase)
MTYILDEIDFELNKILEFANQPRVDWTIDDAFLKGFEEAGELAEAILVVTGRLKHKTLSESHTGEIADNVNQLLDTLSFSTVTSDIKTRYNINELYEHSENVIIGATHKSLNNLEYAAILLFKSYAHYKHLYDINPTVTTFDFLFRELVLINYVLDSIIFHKNNDGEFTQKNIFIDSTVNLCKYLDAKLNKWKSI